jgi:3',5'-cyclic AMP phosphodiesterase CpdA
MRTVVHLSDLHFGAVDDDIVAALIGCVARLEPHVVAVSGDLTQRARRAQFRSARAFLDALPGPQIVVPGNHDVPLYNVLSRFADPLGGYRRYISPERYPAFIDEAIAVVGANTTRSFTIQDGGLRPRDVRHLGGVLSQVSSDVIRIIVCHHPFDPLVGRRARLTTPAPAAGAVDTLIAGGADIFLTGHLHLSYVGHTAARYQTSGRSAIVVEAGTATSIRERGEANAFNVLRVDRTHVRVERLEWNPAVHRFAAAQTDEFIRTDEGWRPSAGGSAR